MKRIVLFSIFAFFTIQLFSVTVIFPNGKILTGDFLALKKNKLFLKNDDNLFIIDSLVIREIQKNDEPISLEFIMTWRNSIINYNKFRNITTINENNFENMTKSYPRLDQELKVIILKDAKKIVGYIEGIETDIVYLSRIGSPVILIINRELIASIVEDGKEITDEVFQMDKSFDSDEHDQVEIVELDFSSEYFNNNNNIPPSRISYYPYKEKKDTNSYFFMGLDLFGDHDLKAEFDNVDDIESSSDVKPGFYIRFEVRGNNQIAFGGGIACQFNKSLSDYRKAKFTYLPFYAIGRLQVDPGHDRVAIKTHLGYNLFFSNRDYAGSLTTKPGLYFAGGMEFTLDDIFIVDIFYTVNKGKCDIIDVTNKSVSMGIGLNLK